MPVTTVRKPWTEGIAEAANMIISMQKEKQEKHKQNLVDAYNILGKESELYGSESPDMVEKRRIIVNEILKMGDIEGFSGATNPTVPPSTMQPPSQIPPANVGPETFMALLGQQQAGELAMNAPQYKTAGGLPYSKREDVVGMGNIAKVSMPSGQLKQPEPYQNYLKKAEEQARMANNIPPENVLGARLRREVVTTANRWYEEDAKESRMSREATQRELAILGRTTASELLKRKDGVGNTIPPDVALAISINGKETWEKATPEQKIEMINTAKGKGSGIISPEDMEGMEFLSRNFVDTGMDMRDFPRFGGMGAVAAQARMKFIGMAAKYAEDTGQTPSSLKAKSIAINAAKTELNKLKQYQAMFGVNARDAEKNFRLIEAKLPEMSGLDGMKLKNALEIRIMGGIIGDAKYRVWAGLIYEATTEYARVVTGQMGGAEITQSAREAQEKILSSTDNQKAVQEIINMSRQVMKQRFNSWTDQEKDIQNQIVHWVAWRPGLPVPEAYIRELAETTSSAGAPPPGDGGVKVPPGQAVRRFLGK